MRVDRHSIRPLDRKQTFLLVAQWGGGALFILRGLLYLLYTASEGLGRSDGETSRALVTPLPLT